MRKTFKYRLFTTRLQSETLDGQLGEACRLYNGALQERRDAYRSHKKSLNYYDQANQLKEIRAAVKLPFCTTRVASRRSGRDWTRAGDSSRATGRRSVNAGCASSASPREAASALRVA